MGRMSGRCMRPRWTNDARACRNFRDYQSPKHVGEYLLRLEAWQVGATEIRGGRAEQRDCNPKRCIAGIREKVLPVRQGLCRSQAPSMSFPPRSSLHPPQQRCADCCSRRCRRAWALLRRGRGPAEERLSTLTALWQMHLAEPLSRFSLSCRCLCPQAWLDLFAVTYVALARHAGPR